MHWRSSRKSQRENCIFGDTGTKCPSVKGEELWVGLGAGGWDESRGPAAGRAGGHWESRMEPGMEGGGCGGPSC